MRQAFALLTIVVAANWSLGADRPSPYGIAKPCILVSGELPKDVENPDGLAVINVLTDPVPAGFQILKAADMEPQPGLVGIHIPPGATVQFRKRAISNLGNGVATLRLAKSASRPARSIELEGKKSADHNEVLRAARERVDPNPFPTAKPGVPNVPNGTLVIVGGGGMPADAAKRFIEAGGGEDGHFVVLPVSMPDPISVETQARFLKQMGAKNVTVLPQREQKDLETPEVIGTLKKATGIWFGGGRQWNFMDAYEGTKLPDLFRNVLARGGVIGGSSAGATIQGEYLVRGAPAGPQIMMCEGYERGLAFLPGVAIDQHFSARKRFPDMTALMKACPQYLGIGIDERTALIVRGSRAEIVGAGKVFIYDRNKAVKEGEADYETLSPGTAYDLSRREIVRPTKKQ